MSRLDQRSSSLPRLAWAAAALLAAACALGSSGCGSTSSDAAMADPLTDKLAQVREKGTLVLSTDADYAPQSFVVAGKARSTPTRCAPDELTAAQVSGFDAETGKLVAIHLGVEPCFVVPSWVEITGGNWNDRWDLSVGSGAIEQSRSQTLAMTRPYYVMPAYVFVRAGSQYRAPQELSGQRVGACTSCTHEEYLRGTLELASAQPIPPRITGATVVTYAVEGPGLKDVARGEIAGFVAAEQVGARALSEGLPLRRVGAPLFTEHATAWADRGSEFGIEAFVKRVDEIIGELHNDESLLKLSKEFFGRDFTSPAATFDLSSVEGSP